MRCAAESGRSDFRRTRFPDQSERRSASPAIKGQFRLRIFRTWPALPSAFQFPNLYKLVSREVKPEQTVVDDVRARVGNGSPAVIAGPCSVDTRADDADRGSGRQQRAKFFRGGAFKPRTSPYAFQGLKEEGCEFSPKSSGRLICGS
mgnify:CR=1 FL=1